MKKGVVLSGFSNIKTMDGSPNPGLSMQVGDYAYGDVSLAGTDLINFTHFYRAGGAKIELGKLCKANCTNMAITTENEPGTDPIPNPDPDPDGVKRIIDSLVTYETNAGAIVSVRLIPE